MADDRAGDAERVDGAEGGGWAKGGGNVQVAPGAAQRAVEKSGAFETARGVVEELSAAGIIRRSRAAQGRAARAGAERHEADGGKSAREWRGAVERPAPAEFHEVCGGRAEARGGGCGGYARAGQVPARCD